MIKIVCAVTNSLFLAGQDGGDFIKRTYKSIIQLYFFQKEIIGTVGIINIFTKLTDPGINPFTRSLVPEKIELLKAVGETQSISAAAKKTGMSYRKAWLLINPILKLLRCINSINFIIGWSGTICIFT